MALACNLQNRKKLESKQQVPTSANFNWTNILMLARKEMELESSLFCWSLSL